MRAARLVTAAAGLGLVLTGAVFLVTTLPFRALVGLAVWLVCALILHDGVFVPLTTAAIAIVNRAGRRFPGAALLTLKAGFALGALLTLVVSIESYVQLRHHPRNPTILVGDYGLRLLLVWAVVLAILAVVTVVTLLRTRRTSDR